MGASEKGRSNRAAVMSADSPVEDLGGGGGVIIAALIIGGAVLAAVVLLWDTRSAAERRREIATLEEESYREHREVYRSLLAGDPEAALRTIGNARSKTDRIAELTRRGDHRLCIVSLLFAAEANFAIGGEERLRIALDEIGKGMALMTHSGGGLWESLYFARARINYELGEYGPAVADLDAVLTFNPGFAPAFYWRSIARKAAGDVAGAEADARKAINLGAWPPEKDFRKAYQARLAANAE